MTSVSTSDGSLREGVGVHVCRLAERSLDIAELNVLSCEELAHVDMASSCLIRGVTSHRNSALVVAINSSRQGGAKTKVKEKHAQIERFFGSFGKSDVFGFLRAKKGGSTEFHLPRARGPVEEEDVGTGGFAIVHVCAPIRIAETVKCEAVVIVCTVNDAEIFSLNEVACDANVRVPMFERRIVNVSTEDAHGMGEVRTRPNSKMDKFTVGLEDFGLQFCIYLRWTVGFGVGDSRVQGCGHAGGRVRVQAHEADEFIPVTARIQAEDTILPVALHVQSKVILQRGAWCGFVGLIQLKLKSVNQPRRSSRLVGVPSPCSRNTYTHRSLPASLNWGCLVLIQSRKVFAQTAPPCRLP